MPNFIDTRLVPYQDEIIKEVILDIEKYPDFLPWCPKAKILSRRDNILEAELQIGFGSFSTSYVSEVCFFSKDDNYQVVTKAIYGPFEHLNSIWTVKKQDNVSLVQFSIDFTVKSKILESIIEMFFLKATKEIISAFENRVRYLSNIKG